MDIEIHDQGDGFICFYDEWVNKFHVFRWYRKIVLNAINGYQCAFHIEPYLGIYACAEVSTSKEFGNILYCNQIKGLTGVDDCEPVASVIGFIINAGAMDTNLRYSDKCFGDIEF